MHIAYTKGIALVEVLITTVVTAIGSLAVILLLNNLNASSALSQARDEALSLANSKIESVLNSLDKKTYQNISSGQQLEIKGLQTTYDMSWTIEELQKPQRKKLKLNVSWDAKKSQIETVHLTQILSWNNPLISASIASYGVKNGFVYLSPNQKGSFGDKKEVKITQTDKLESLPYNIKKYQDLQANIIFLNKQNKRLFTIFSDQNQPKAKPAYLSISGALYYQGDLSKLTFAASQGGYCVFPIAAKKILNSDWEYAKYYCIVVNQWHGKIGVIAPTLDKDSLFCPQQTREYLFYTMRNSTQLTQQGISENFSDQDFVIARKSSENNCQAVVKNLSNRLIQPLKSPFPPTISAQNHTFLGSNNVHTLSGNIILPSVLQKNKKNLQLNLSLDDLNHDCRILNKLDAYEDVYSCVVQVAKPSNENWQGIISGNLYLADTSKPLCSFQLAYKNQYKLAILDLDLGKLCPLL